MTALQTPSIPLAANIVAKAPIGRWMDALRMSDGQAIEELRQAYCEHLPTQGEMIFTGACDFTCQHCIYPPSFARFNKALPADRWDGMLEDIRQMLDIRTFVYGGRSLTPEGLDVLTRLRGRCPDVQIGLIDNGISMEPVRERLHDVRADWIDISLDGQERDHDLQRGREGSYRAGIEGARWLVDSGVAPKVNILTCLTTINRASVIPMIRELNAEGFRNFFITPVTIVEGVRPAPQLRVEGESLVEFIRELREALPSMDEAWVELTFYSTEYAKNVAMLAPELWRQFSLDRDGFVWAEPAEGGEAVGGSQLFVRYYPISLTGVRELIVNTNGDVIMPKSVGLGQVDRKAVAGNLLQQDVRQIVAELPRSNAFAFYWKEFQHEQDLLRRYV